jgi:hypothetical protein
MTIPFEQLKARLLANPKVKAEYEALAPEFEIKPSAHNGLGITLKTDKTPPDCPP